MNTIYNYNKLCKLSNFAYAYILFSSKYFFNPNTNVPFYNT